MTTIRAIVRQGRIEVDSPLDLPEGTVLTIPVPTSVGPRDADLDDTPEGIESWIRWYESLEPVELTADEAARWLIARQAQRQFELANWDLQSDRAEQQFG